MHDDFMATVYPKFHESLKLPADEQVILEDPLSSSETLSSMKNLDDTYTFGDQFFNNKSIKDELGKPNVDAKVVSMATVPIHGASTLVPPLSTPIIDLSHSTQVSSPLQELFIDKTNQALSSKIFILEFRDVPHKINQTVNEFVKEAVHVALQAPFRDYFRELFEADMKEILHQQMFECGSSKSLPEHVALYEALKASMKRGLSLLKERFFLFSTFSAKSVPHSEQPVEEVHVPNDVNILDSEDTYTALLPRIKTRPDWLKPIPEEEKPITPEPY
nr:hypothetical protein [Tanacetum cinerariifolium]